MKPFSLQTWPAETLVVACLLCLLVAGDQDQYDADSALFEKSKLDNPLAFDAIKELHRQMDDDRSGSVDINESVGFVRDELHIQEKDRVVRRQKAFHENDDEQITVDDLWHRWLRSEVLQWTTPQMIYWLINFVELPQYEQTFLENKVNGSAMPRLASPDGAYMKELQIVNSVHRHKLQLKALDIVLFGFRHHISSYAKDAVLVALLATSVVGYWFAIYQRQTAHRKLKVLSNHLDRLKDMEHDFAELQKKMEKAHEVPLGNEFEEISQRQLQMQEMEKEFEGRIPLLQKLLAKTYEVELARLNHDKIENLKEMQEAREWVEKLSKRHSSFMSQIRSVHGSESEQIDHRVLMLKEKMEHTAQALEEHNQRWSQIEVICGFPVHNMFDGSTPVLSPITAPVYGTPPTTLMPLPVLKTACAKSAQKSASDVFISNCHVDRMPHWPALSRSEEMEDISSASKSSSFSKDEQMPFNCNNDESTPVPQRRRLKLFELAKSGSLASNASCTSKDDGSDSSTTTTDSRKRNIFSFKKIKLR